MSTTHLDMSDRKPMKLSQTRDQETFAPRWCAYYCSQKKVTRIKSLYRESQCSAREITKEMKELLQPKAEKGIRPKPSMRPETTTKITKKNKPTTQKKKTTSANVTTKKQKPKKKVVKKSPERTKRARKSRWTSSSSSACESSCCSHRCRCDESSSNCSCSEYDSSSYSSESSEASEDEPVCECKALEEIYRKRTNPPPYTPTAHTNSPSVSNVSPNREHVLIPDVSRVIADNLMADVSKVRNLMTFRFQSPDMPT